MLELSAKEATEEMRVYRCVTKDRYRLPVAQAKGTATANPSGILCRAIASAVRAPSCGSETLVSRVRMPSGRLCNSRAAPVTSAARMAEPWVREPKRSASVSSSGRAQANSQAASIPPSSSAAAAAPQPKGESSAP